jgi:hypothetical protein
MEYARKTNGSTPSLAQRTRAPSSLVLTRAPSSLVLRKGWKRHAGSNLETSRETRTAHHAE